MWLIVVFDLPMTSSAEKKAYRVFLKNLRSSGFMREQHSVYKRWVESRRHAVTIVKRLRGKLPERGQVVIFKLPQVILQSAEYFKDTRAIPVPTPPTPWQII